MMANDYTKPLKILKASAGSGKTFNLTVMFLTLLFSDENNYRRIMAVTFTNKATAEMKQRILSVLKYFAEGDWPNATAYLSEIRKHFPGITNEEIQKKATHLYRQILHDYGRLTITTIDKFVQQIIRSFTFELGIDSDYQITLNYRQVKDDLTELLHHSLDEKPELLKWIVERAKARIREGKNWNYQNELKNLASNIFSEDFQDFDKELQGKDSDLLFENDRIKIDQTLTDFEDRISQWHARMKVFYNTANPASSELKGGQKSPLNYLGKDFKVFFGQLLNKGLDLRFLKLIDLPEEWFKPNATATTRILFSQVNPVLKELLAFFNLELPAYNLAGALDENIYYLRLIKEMSVLLRDYRVNNHLLLISDATNLLEGITAGMGDNPSFIWEKVGNRYRHFLFDEFQDTSGKQWNNFKPLVKNALASGSGMHTEHLVVGDVKQSIYRWRGGDWDILLHQVEKDLGSPLVEVESLQKNFRSDARIVYFNNFIFPYVANWIQEAINDEVAKGEPEAFANTFWKGNQLDRIICQAYEDVQQKLPEGKKPEEGIVEWKVFPVVNTKSRVRDTKEDILKYTADQLYRWTEEEKRYKPGQIGILLRKNSESKELIHYLEKDLQKRGNPLAYQVISGEALSLKDNPAIGLLIETLRGLTATTGNKPFHYGVCTYLLDRLKSRTGKSILTPEDWMKMGHDGKALSILPEEIFDPERKWDSLPLSEVVEEMIAVYGIGEDAKWLTGLLAFKDCVTDFLNGGGFEISAFLEWWDAEDDLTLPSTEMENAIQIMTVHKAKGLAFDVVVLPFLMWEFDGFRNGQFWVDVKGSSFDELSRIPLKYNSRLKNSEVKAQYYKEKLYSFMDTLNTMYVAMTRPRKHLLLCISDYGKSLPAAFTVGDLLQEAFADYKTRNGKELFFSEKEEFTGFGTLAGVDSGTGLLNSYPVAHHLKKAIEKTTANKLQRMEEEESIRIGIAVHELLSACRNEDELDPVIQKLFQEGWFLKKERQEIRELALRVFNNQALRTLWHSEDVVWKEKEVIDKEGNIYRPDKVLVGKETTVIIDYKFGKELESHGDQVRNYKVLFEEMGFPKVRGFLFYGFQEKLIEV